MRRGFSGVHFSRNLHPILLPLLPGWQRLRRILYPAPTPGELHAGSLRAEFAVNSRFPFVNPSHLQICSTPHDQQDNLIIWKSRSPRREHFPAPWGSRRSDTCVFNKPDRCARLPCLQEGERQWNMYGCSGCSPVNCYKSPSNVKLFFKTWSCWSISGKIYWIKRVSSDKLLICDRARLASAHTAKGKKIVFRWRWPQVFSSIFLPGEIQAVMNLKGSVWGWRAVGTTWVSILWDFPLKCFWCWCCDTDRCQAEIWPPVCEAL